MLRNCLEAGKVSFSPCNLLQTLHIVIKWVRQNSTNNRRNTQRKDLSSWWTAFWMTRTSPSKIRSSDLSNYKNSTHISTTSILLISNGDHSELNSFSSCCWFHVMCSSCVHCSVSLYGWQPQWLNFSFIPLTWVSSWLVPFRRWIILSPKPEIRNLVCW